MTDQEQADAREKYARAKIAYDRALAAAWETPVDSAAFRTNRLRAERLRADVERLARAAGITA
jgi:hypothetical protein